MTLLAVKTCEDGHPEVRWIGPDTCWICREKDPERATEHVKEVA